MFKEGLRNSAAAGALFVGGLGIACGGGEADSPANISSEVDSSSSESSAEQGELTIEQQALKLSLERFLSYINSRKELEGDAGSYLELRITEGLDNFPIDELARGEPIEENEDFLRMESEIFIGEGRTLLEGTGFITTTTAETSKGEREMTNFGVYIEEIDPISETDRLNGLEYSSTNVITFSMRRRVTDCEGRPHLFPVGEFGEWRDVQFSITTRFEDGNWKLGDQKPFNDQGFRCQD